MKFTYKYYMENMIIEMHCICDLGTFTAFISKTASLCTFIWSTSQILDTFVYIRGKNLQPFTYNVQILTTLCFIHNFFVYRLLIELLA